MQSGSTVELACPGGTVTLEPTDVIGPGSLPPSMHRAALPRVPQAQHHIPDEGIDLEEALGRLEKDLLLEALRKAGGVRTDASRLLGITFRSMRYRLRKHPLSDEEDVE